MKLNIKIVTLFIFSLLLLMPAYSAEKKDSTSVWGEKTEVFNSGFDGQKPVTDTAFNKTVKQLKERALTSKQRKMRKEVVPLSPSSDAEHLKNFTDEQTYDDGASNSHMVMIPLSAYSIDGQMLQPGYYKLTCRKLSKDDYVIDLSQGDRKMVTVKAMQTKQDLEQETLSFGKAEIIDDNRIRLIYGTIDLNLVGYLYFK